MISTSNSLKTLSSPSMTLLLAAGVSVKVLSERLGHESPSTTLTHYAHLLPDSQEAAALATNAILFEAGVKAPRQPHAGTGQENTSPQVAENVELTNGI